MSSRSPTTAQAHNAASVAVAWALLAAVAMTPSTVGGADADLFGTSEPLEIELALDFAGLCRGAGSDDCADLPATLTYVSADGVDRRLPVSVRARGRWRNDPDNCSTPPLAVIFDTASTEGALFAGQTMLPLTTHCRDRPSYYEQYVLKENLTYRIYNALTDMSLRTRLARVTYRDTGRRARPTVERYAFFTEHFDSLAARHGAQFWPTDSFDPSDADVDDLAMVELFEFMIGNTDWSLIAGHNIAHLRSQGGPVGVVAYDFDFSGIVAAPYATPPPNLRIRRVTQRLYRGFCHPGLDWERLFARFEGRRTAIEAVIESEVEALEASHRANARAYVDEFFALISSPERRQAAIVGACRPPAASSGP
jgi:hypothetical protein